MINPILKKLTDLSAKRSAIVERLIAPSRAACNAMKDANMNRTAEPLAQVLFELEAVDDELREVFSTDPKAAVEALISGFKKREEDKS